MCGIFGVFNHNIDPALAEKCLNTLIHRGPDMGGLWQEEGITLGHRRLSILDTSEKGKQPMFYGKGNLNGDSDSNGDSDNNIKVSPDSRYVLTYNGEIYNFLEIKKELMLKGYRFESESDSEVILAAFDCYREDCLKKFNGMWAFAIYDRQEKRLFLSRDRFGVKPLFIYRFKGRENQIAFASEMKALFPLMDEVKPNRALVSDPDRMMYYESTRECVIEGIIRFPAANYCYIDRNGIESGKYYNTLDELISPPKTYEEQVEEFRELFLDACRIRMRSDVTIGTALSGGLDSSATICAMAKLSKEGGEKMSRDWQHAYVASFPGTALDESAYAKKVTDFLGINSTFVNIDPLKAVDKLDEMIYLFEDVYLTSPIPMMLLYNALKRDNTVVTIDGHGADELFGGYTFDFINALSDAKGKAERDMILDAYIESFPKSGNNSLKGNTRKKVLVNFLKRKIRNSLRAEKEPYKKVRARGMKAYEEMDTLNKILYQSSHETILPTLLRNYDRYSMASGVEIRMPFMDYRIVSYAMSLDFRSKLHGGYSKSIIRDACAPFMPEEIAYRRTKIGFNTPIVEWMKGPLKEYFTDIIESTGFSSCDLIKPGETKALVRHVINDDFATFAEGEKAFSMLYPYLWERALIKRDHEYT